jgi:hypothetical protein
MGTGRLERLHPAVVAMLTELGTSAVRWCLLRHGPDPRRLDGDVDLLVHPRDLRVARELLTRRSGFADVRAWGRWPHRFFVADVPGERNPLKLDVVSELAFGPLGELPTRAAIPVLARRVRDGAVAWPDPADAFWALLMHVLLDRSNVSPVRARELAALAPTRHLDDSPLRPLMDAACPAGWNAGRIARAAEAGSFGELFALVPELRARWPDSRPGFPAARALYRRGVRRACRHLVGQR